MYLEDKIPIPGILQKTVRTKLILSANTMTALVFGCILISMKRILNSRRVFWKSGVGREPTGISTKDIGEAEDMKKVHMQDSKEEEPCITPGIGTAMIGHHILGRHMHKV